MHTITSLHKNIPTAPPRLMMHIANIISSNTIAAKIINSIITITLLSSTIESVNNANYMNLLLTTYLSLHTKSSLWYYRIFVE